MVNADGSILGVANGQNSEQVEFCAGCHGAVEAQDYLFFLPEEARVR